MNYYLLTYICIFVVVSYVGIGEDDESSNWPMEGPGQIGRKKKRKSRWGADEGEKIFIPGMPTAIPNKMSDQQEEQYLGILDTLLQSVHLQVPWLQNTHCSTLPVHETLPHNSQ